MKNERGFLCKDLVAWRWAHCPHTVPLTQTGTPLSKSLQSHTRCHHPHPKKKNKTLKKKTFPSQGSLSPPELLEQEKLPSGGTCEELSLGEHWEISLKGPASHFPLHPQPLTLLSCKGIGCPLLMNPRNPFSAAKPPFSTLPPTQRLEFSCSSVLRSAQKQQSLKSFCFQTLHPLLQLQSRNQCGAWRFCNTS